MEQLEEFINSSNEDIVAMATVMSLVTASYEGGVMTKSEYEETIANLLDANAIEAMCEAIEDKAEFEKFVSVVTAISTRLLR